ncbi:hypothetical protein FRB93_005525 [Tulasnella sp. JGI-2019a]|nr:hypothetical protein FRB93_005525 [Tulasnella sp. JGI-2019a]
MPLGYGAIEAGRHKPRPMVDYESICYDMTRWRKRTGQDIAMFNNWGAGNQYEVGEVVIYQGYYYKNIQVHTSQNDWAPDSTPALWGRQGKCDEFFSSQEDADNLKNAHQEVENAPHKAKLSHELVAGAAAFEAARAWEHHKAKNGEPPKHEHAKEIFAGIIGAAVDRIVETKGLDAFDKQKAKKEAQKRAEEQAASNY